MRKDKIQTVCVIAASAMLALTGSCSGGGKDAYDYAETVESAFFDTVAEVVEAPKDPKPAETPEVIFESREKAIEYMGNTGHWDLYSEGIIPQMAEDNLRYASKLLSSDYDYFIVVDKAVMKVMLFNRYGVLVKEYGMCCGKNFGSKTKKGDMRTPEGFFSVEGVYDSTDWLYTDDNGVTSPVKGVYGKRFIRVKNPVTSTIGIHGTNSPGSIGRRSSHGCIRLKNEDIMDLAKYATKGMPIIISPSKADMNVNRKEGRNIAAIYTGAEPLVREAKQLQPKKEEIDIEGSIMNARKEISPQEHQEAVPQDEVPEEIREMLEVIESPSE